MTETMSSQFHGSFGGLWTDRVDALDELERRVSSGAVAPQLRDHLAHFIQHGYVVVEGAVPPELCDRLREEQSDIFQHGSTEHLWFGGPSGIPTLVPPAADIERSRIPDLHGPTSLALDVVLAPTVVDFFTTIFEEPPLLFQTLSFERGSQQPLHQDTAYVVVDPPMSLAAVWVALEDIQPGSGELQYLDGSHRIPEYRFSGEFKHWNPVRDGAEQHTEWAQGLLSNGERLGMTRQGFLPRKGDVLIWAADLVHGGGAVTDPGLTRRSIVGHMCPVSANPHYFSLVPGRVKMPWRNAFASSIYYDFAGGYPAHEPLLVGGAAPERPAGLGPDPTRARMISFAQNAEDVVLRNAFGARRRGFYVDVGANHPVWDSVTKHFYDKGWRGINIDPVHSLHAELQAQRPRDINLCVGVGEHPGQLEFGEVPGNPGLSTFNSTLDAKNAGDGCEVVHRTVPVRTLADILAEHVSGEIDFLKVDVEGFEGPVFRGNDWSRFRPKVIIAESNFAEDWHGYVESQGYTQTLTDGLNRFYVRNDLLDSLGQRLNRPAVHAVDAYDPWYYVSQLEAAASVPSHVHTEAVQVARSAAAFPRRVARRLRAAVRG